MELKSAVQAINETPHQYAPIVKKVLKINDSCQIVEAVRDEALEKLCTADNITKYVGVSAPELIEPIKDAIKEIPVASYADLAQAVDYFSADSEFEPLLKSVYGTLGDNGKAFISKLRDKVIDDYAAQISNSQPALQGDLNQAALILKAIPIDKLIPVAAVFLEESHKMNGGSLVGGSTASALQKSLEALEKVVDDKDKPLLNKLKGDIPKNLEFKPVDMKGVAMSPSPSPTPMQPADTTSVSASASTTPSPAESAALVQAQEAAFRIVLAKIPKIPPTVLRFLTDGEGTDQTYYLSSMVDVITRKANGELPRASKFVNDIGKIFDDHDQRERDTAKETKRSLFVFADHPEWKQQIFDNLVPDLQKAALDANPYLVYKVFYNSSKEFNRHYSLNMMLTPDLLNAMNIDGFIAFLQTCKPDDIKAKAFDSGLTPEVWAKLDPDIMKAVPLSVLKGLDPAYIKTMTAQYFTAFASNNAWILMCFSLIVTVSNLVAYGITTTVFNLQTPANMKPPLSKAAAAINWGTEEEGIDMSREMVEDDVDYTEEELPEEPPLNPSVNKNFIFMHFAIQFVIGCVLVGLLYWMWSGNGWSDVLGVPMRPRRIELWHIAGLFVVYQVVLFLITLVGCFRELFETNGNVFGPMIFGFPSSMIYNLEGDNIDKAVLYHYVLFCGYFMMSLVVMYLFLPFIVAAKYALMGKNLVDETEQK